MAAYRADLDAVGPVARSRPSGGVDPGGRLVFHNYMNEPNNLSLSLTFGRGEVHICMPALAIKVEPSPSTGKAVRVWISLNKTRPGESPIEIALFPSPESFLAHDGGSAFEEPGVGESDARDGSEVYRWHFNLLAISDASWSIFARSFSRFAASNCAWSSRRSFRVFCKHRTA
jgi:hypothetical protein